MSTETELRTILSGICKSDKQLRNFVKALEGDAPNIGADTDNFYKAYVIFIFQKYCCSLDDRELALMSCRLLQGDGFCAKRLEDRAIAYWHYSRTYNKLFEDTNTEKSAERKARSEMERILDYLDEDLNKYKNNNNGKLGLLDEVRKEWEVHGLELPKPRELEATTPDVPVLGQPDSNVTDLEENEQEAEDKFDASSQQSESEAIEDDMVHQADDSEITEIDLQEDDCIEISDSKVDDDIIQHPDEPKRTENDNPENPSPEPPSPPKPTGNDSIAFMIRAVSIALVIAVTALAFVAITRNSEREKEITAALVDKDRIIPNKITIINKNIEIPLGGSDYLTIKTEPLELNQNDLFYLCVNLDIAHMENIHSGHVIAATQIPNNVEWETDILVHDLDGTTQDTAHVYVTKTGNNDSLSPKGSNKKTDFTGARQ